MVDLPAITRAGPAHAGLLAALHGLSFERGWTEDEFLSLMSSPGTWVLVASGTAGAGGGDPLGFVMMRTAGGEAECLTLCTVPQARRRGVARRLLDAALADPACAGQRVFLEVAADNEAARALYLGAGFAQVGRRKAYYEGPAGRTDALVLARDVRSPG